MIHYDLFPFLCLHRILTYILLCLTPCIIICLYFPVLVSMPYLVHKGVLIMFICEWVNKWMTRWMNGSLNNLISCNPWWQRTIKKRQERTIYFKLYSRYILRLLNKSRKNSNFYSSLNAGKRKNIGGGSFVVMQGKNKYKHELVLFKAIYISLT